MSDSTQDPRGGISRRGFFQRTALAGAALSLVERRALAADSGEGAAEALPANRWGSPRRCAASDDLLEADETTLW